MVECLVSLPDLALPKVVFLYKELRSSFCKNFADVRWPGSFAAVD